MHSARLIWITPEAESIIAYCARVSSKKQNNPNILKLLQYCANHGHWSIFEMASMCVEVTTTRAISPQILRHRSFSFQEFSQRYSDPSQASDNPLPSMVDTVYEQEIRLQDRKNRQNSIEVDQSEFFDFKKRSAYIASLSQQLYDDMMEANIAKEVARGVLLINTPTRLYMSGTIRSWIHYLSVRADEATQKEHRVIADSILDILSREAPIVHQFIEEKLNGN